MAVEVSRREARRAQPPELRRALGGDVRGADTASERAHYEPRQRGEGARAPVHEAGDRARRGDGSAGGEVEVQADPESREARRAGHGVLEAR